MFRTSVDYPLSTPTHDNHVINRNFSTKLIQQINIDLHAGRKIPWACMALGINEKFMNTYDKMIF